MLDETYMFCSEENIIKQVNHNSFLIFFLLLNKTSKFFFFLKYNVLSEKCVNTFAGHSEKVNF